MIDKVKLEFDPIFHDKLESGQKVITFRKGPAVAKWNDIFFVNHVPYQITQVMPGISLWYFVTHFWHDDGWNCPEDAVEWMKQHYFNGNIQEQYGAEFKALKGCAYLFTKLSPEWLRYEISKNIDNFNKKLWDAQRYMEILRHYKPETAGYDKSYLGDCMDFLQNVDDDDILFNFEDRLFPSEEEDA